MHATDGHIMRIAVLPGRQAGAIHWHGASTCAAAPAFAAPCGGPDCTMPRLRAAKSGDMIELPASSDKAGPHQPAHPTRRFAGRRARRAAGAVGATGWRVTLQTAAKRVARTNAPGRT